MRTETLNLAKRHWRRREKSTPSVPEQEQILDIQETPLEPLGECTVRKSPQCTGHASITVNGLKSCDKCFYFVGDEEERIEK